MRPNKLIMTGFGPYAARTEINLDELGEKGLYLITGTTGAGKTTIFDAITYALYGEASGKNRDAGMFRSKFADGDTPTEVELWFTNNGKTYHVKRNPEYMRNKKNGEGTTKTAAGAELTDAEGIVLAVKTTEVNTKIKEILGVDKNQFAQIVMLAQGAFLDMLFADTVERAKIFRNIFKTDNYQRLQDELATRAAGLSKDMADTKKKIGTFLTSTECDENNPLSVDLKKAKNGESQTAELVDLLEKIISEDKESADKLTEELKKADEEIEALTKTIENGKNIRETRSELEIEKEKLKELEIELIRLTKEAEEAKKNKPEMEAAKNEATTMRVTISQYDELEAERKQVKDAEKSMTSYNKIKQEAEEQEAELKKEIEKLTQEKQGLKDSSAEVEKIKNEGQNKLKELDSLKELEKSSEDYETLLKNLRTAQTLYQKAQADADAAQKAWNDKNRAYLANQAGILAEGLNEDEPCPVCGSLHHPKLAEKSAEAPTKEQLEQLKTASEAAEKKARKASEAAGTKRGEAENARQTIEDTASALLGENTNIEDVSQKLAAKKEALSTLIEKLQKDYKAAKNNEKRRAELEELIPKKTDEAEALKKKASEAEKKAAEDAVRKSTSEKRISDLEKSLPFKSKNDAMEHIGDLEKKAEAIQTCIDKATNGLQEASDRKNTLAGGIGKLEEKLKNVVEIDVEAEQEKQSEIKESRKEKAAKQTAIISRINANEKAEDGIKDAIIQIADTEEKYRWVKALADAARGEVSGKDKINLETYVQTFYFDRIVKRANVRFLKMTDGHYELKRGAATNKQSKAGLDLSIIDHYNGAERSVKSLSGGESFEAALSLALGLADEIQESAGGIHLDTMFVDEGFGSLDEESLDKAIKALESLSEGNRLVGIISHVAEIKRRIENQIVVTKEKTGE
ncbi:MAG: SMC family ATPase, partial [Lachnospiraceae bacterium]|nr:SMC family ATPase [Lachnospiraceae bacterium]